MTINRFVRNGSSAAPRLRVAAAPDPDSCSDCAHQDPWGDPLCPAHRGLKQRLGAMQNLGDAQTCLDCARQGLGDDPLCEIHRMQKRLALLVR